MLQKLISEKKLTCVDGNIVPSLENMTVLDEYSDQIDPLEFDTRIMCQMPWNIFKKYVPRFKKASDKLVALPFLFESSTCLECVSLLSFEMPDWIKYFIIRACHLPHNYYTFPKDNAVLTLFHRSNSLPFKKLFKNFTSRRLLPSWIKYELLVKYGTSIIKFGWIDMWSMDSDYFEKTLVLLQPNERGRLFTSIVRRIRKSDLVKEGLLNLSAHAREMFNIEMIEHASFYKNPPF